MPPAPCSESWLRLKCKWVARSVHTHAVTAGSSLSTRRRDQSPAPCDYLSRRWIPLCLAQGFSLFPWELPVSWGTVVSLQRGGLFFSEYSSMVCTLRSKCLPVMHICWEVFPDGLISSVSYNLECWLWCFKEAILMFLISNLVWDECHCLHSPSPLGAALHCW